jgi:hypothetical protein
MQPVFCANKVKSELHPTFSPAFIDNPRCFKIILPALIKQPPKYFNPKRLEIELRPFLVFPAPFLF